MYKQRQELQRNLASILLLKNKSQKSHEYGFKPFLQKECVWGKKKFKAQKESVPFALGVILLQVY